MALLNQNGSLKFIKGNLVLKQVAHKININATKCCSSLEIDDQRGSNVFDGTYVETGTHRGYLAYKRTSPSEAWIWRRDDAFNPWIITASLGDESDLNDFIQQQEASSEAKCANETDIWEGIPVTVTCS